MRDYSVINLDFYLRKWKHHFSGITGASWVSSWITSNWTVCSAACSKFPITGPSDRNREKSGNIGFWEKSRKSQGITSTRMLCCHCLPPGSLCVLGYLGDFYRAIYILKWYKMVCMRYLVCTFSQMKYINMFSMYLQSGIPRHLVWRFITVWT